MDLKRARQEYRSRFNKARNLLEFLESPELERTVSKLDIFQLARFELLLEDADLDTIHTFLSRINLSMKSVHDLRKFAAEQRIKGYYRMSKTELVEALK